MNRALLEMLGVDPDSVDQLGYVVAVDRRNSEWIEQIEWTKPGPEGGATVVVISPWSDTEFLEFPLTRLQMIGWFAAMGASLVQLRAVPDVDLLQDYLDESGLTEVLRGIGEDRAGPGYIVFEDRGVAPGVQFEWSNTVTTGGRDFFFAYHADTDSTIFRPFRDDQLVGLFAALGAWLIDF